MDHEHQSKRHKLGVVSGVYIPVCLNILSILMFLRFGSILGQIGLLGMLGMSFPELTLYHIKVMKLTFYQDFSSLHTRLILSLLCPYQPLPPMVKLREGVPTTSSPGHLARSLEALSVSCFTWRRS